MFYQVRGENYDQVRESSKISKTKESTKSKKKDKKRNKSQQPRLYEANDYDDDNNQSALRIGLGDSSASHEARKRTNEISIPLEDRVKRLEEEDAMTGKKSTYRAGQGIVNEMTYIPKDTRRKLEEQKRRREEYNTDGNGKRKRRGVKALKLKKLSS